ncbi:MAG: hypothetical protein Q4D13_04105 [Erysipelotrichaceae bacterium]|nr:hypothetical protein [Erysipelotrichaceae bacterium]
MNPHAIINDESYIKALDSIRRVDEKGYLYEMECDYDYYSLPEQFKLYLSAGCSTFFTKNLEGEYMLCRNYDYGHYFMNDRHNERTGLNVIVKGNNPKAKYKSIGVGDAYWLDYKNGMIKEGMADDGKSDLSAFVMMPFLCMDGINEKGLGVSIMALVNRVEWEEIEYEGAETKVPEFDELYVLENKDETPDPLYLHGREGSIAVNNTDKKAWIAHMTTNDTTMPGKPPIIPPIMMRMMLDNCANVDEAVAFADGFNMKSVVPGSDYHIMLVDESGKSRLLEWVDNRMNVIDINHATNYRVSTEDGFHGKCGRDECIKAGLYRTQKGGMREDFAKNLLSLIAQDPTNGNDKGKTQYSCIYHLKSKTMKIYSFGDFEKSFDYNL